MIITIKCNDIKLFSDLYPIKIFRTQTILSIMLMLMDYRNKNRNPDFLVLEHQYRKIFSLKYFVATDGIIINTNNIVLVV